MSRLVRDLRHFTSSGAILRDRAFEVLQLLAGQQANVPERSEVLVRVGEIARQEVRLTDVLVRATMARIELDGALVVREREVVLLQIAIGIAEDVLQVRVVGIAYLGTLEKAHGLRPILLVDRPFARSVVLVPLGEIGICVDRVGGGDRGKGHDRRA